ncbi:MAG: single-stranded-DNA-specific exonuclease RecJ, partial [Clostridia bacterium]|nr:single-stranded-DNA-specific exonuclease RecJ [Clostridia bacterium]
MGRKKWVVSEIDKDLCAEISQQYGVSPFAALVAVSKGITQESDLEDFFSEEPVFFRDPYELPDMEKAVFRIRKALEENEKIAVFGDYDADGVTSTALLYSYLKKCGADVIYYIPDRNSEGYGMNLQAIDKISAQGVKLIITVDNGISAFEEAQRIKQLGMELVVTDHHRAGETLPEAFAVVDAFRLDFQDDGFREWAGVGVVYKLIEALEEDDSGQLLEEYSDLVAIGTIGDVVNLRSENRQFVKSGVSMINENTRVGIEALRSAAGYSEKELTSTSVAFSLCPRINAAGRMGSALTALKLLLCEDKDEADKLAEKINQANILRQSTEMEILKSAVEIAESRRLKYDRVLVVEGDDWHTGVIGIVAARMVEKYSKPCIIISKQPDGSAKGSGRSIPGFSLYDALKYCEGTLSQYGGHTLAAGLSLESEEIEAFREKVNDYAKQCGDFFPQLTIDCRLNPKFLNLELLEAIKALEPFGAGNKQPVFGLYNMYLEKVEGVSNGKHCRLLLSRNGSTLSAMKFGVSPEELDFKAGDTVDAAVCIDKNVYMGAVRLSVTVRDLKFSSLKEDSVIESILLYEKIKRKEKVESLQALK